MHYPIVPIKIKSIIPLVLACLIYVLFRSRPTIVEEILGLNFPATFSHLERTVLIGSLPDALWFYFLLSWIKSAGYSASILMLVLTISSEFAQLQFTPGTFDPFDVAAYMSAFIIYNLLNPIKDDQTKKDINLC